MLIIMTDILRIDKHYLYAHICNFMVCKTTGTGSMIAVCYSYRIKLYRIYVSLFIVILYTLWLSFNAISLNIFDRVPVTILSERLWYFLNFAQKQIVDTC